ncbi:MAG: glycosyltransferase family 2 protein, partial [Acidobacteriota bacterium]|nr:glycosyltransferase family 2 protein [Acidobacteriota bacterium]
MTGFLILAILLLIQSILSLRGGFEFLSFLRRSRQRLPDSYNPYAAVIIPCKGLDKDLETNAARFLAQLYPHYQVIFVVASREDPAYAYLSALIRRMQSGGSENDPRCELVIAGYAESNGEKVNNLLAGLNCLDQQAEVLVFADIDIEPEKTWLQTLVAPLGDASTTLSTGFRWYLPGPTFTSRLRSAWDSSIATMMGDHPHNFAWGGSMAIRRTEFARLRVAEDYWQGTVSDDYAITRAVRNAGGAIRFEPRCLVASRSAASLRQFVAWANRQIIITRVYHKKYWALGLASYALYGLTFAWGLAVIIFSASAPHRIASAVLLAAVEALGVAKGALRTVAARELFPGEVETLARHGNCYWRLAPLVPWFM